jgi:hypothetical protein
MIDYLCGAASDPVWLGIFRTGGNFGNVFCGTSSHVILVDSQQMAVAFSFIMLLGRQWKF